VSLCDEIIGILSSSIVSLRRGESSS